MAEDRNPRAAARFLATCADRAAQQTRAIRRGVVDSIAEDGRPIVILPNGGKIKIRPTNLFQVSEGQSVNLTKVGSCWEVLAPSAYGGGLGSPFEAPP